MNMPPGKQVKPDRTNGTRFRVLALLVGILTALLLTEGALRIYRHFGFSSFVFRQYDPILGTSLISNARGVHRWCWDGYVEINEHGMIGKSVDVNKPEGCFRIGVFGDSVMEAVHVKYHERATTILERNLNDLFQGKSIQVLNFSVASYSTLQEYLRYEYLGKYFDLDLVIIVIIPNDLIANVDPGDVMAGSFYFAPYLSKSGTGLNLVPPRRPSKGLQLVADLSKWSDIALFSSKVFYRLVLPRLKKPQFETPPWTSVPLYKLYDLENSYAQTVWSALSYVVSTFSNSVKEDGKRFCIAFVAIEDNPWEYPPPEGSDIPASFQPNMMTIELENLGERLGFPVYNLGAHLREYISENNLSYPHLSFTCDRHYNSTGQRVIADGLTEFLVSHALVEDGS